MVVSIMVITLDVLMSRDLSAWPPKHSFPMELSMAENLGDGEEKMP